jgi:hypothetical protein
MHGLAGENELDLEALRARLRTMSDDELNHFGRLHGTCAHRPLITVKSPAEYS